MKKMVASKRFIELVNLAMKWTMASRRYKYDW